MEREVEVVGGRRVDERLAALRQGDDFGDALVVAGMEGWELVGQEESGGQHLTAGDRDGSEQVTRITG